MIPYLKRGKHVQQVVTMIISLFWAVIFIILGEYHIWTTSYSPWSSNIIPTYRNDSPDADACYSQVVPGHVSQAAKRAKSRPTVESPQRRPRQCSFGVTPSPGSAVSKFKIVPNLLGHLILSCQWQRRTRTLTIKPTNDKTISLI